MNVAEWLRALGLEQYAAAFPDNEIDERVLPSLTAADLKDLGVSLIGHRRLLLDAIAALREAPPKQVAFDLPSDPAANTIWFTEGFDTADLNDAKDLLEQSK